MRVLVVRLSSLGDVIHTVPVAAALRRQFPDATIDWIANTNLAELLSLVPSVDRLFTLGSGSYAEVTRWVKLRSELRNRQYDVALDVQGLMKSGFVAWLSGAKRVIGFSEPFLREKYARYFYDESVDLGNPVHVVERNLSILKAVGVDDREWAFPFDVPSLGVVDDVTQKLESSRGQYAILNPTTAWPNKCWPAERFGAVAEHIRKAHGLTSVVVWGPGDKMSAEAVVSASCGTAICAPETSLVELACLLNSGVVLVSGDTGPLHLAAALGTPVVGIYGPSSPVRNGPWSPEDEVASISDECHCLQQQEGHSATGMVRQCRHTHWCLGNLTVEAVCAAVDRRLRNVVTYA